MTASAGRFCLSRTVTCKTCVSPGASSATRQAKPRPPPGMSCSDSSGEDETNSSAPARISVTLEVFGVVRGVAHDEGDVDGVAGCSRQTLRDGVDARARDAPDRDGRPVEVRGNEEALRAHRAAAHGLVRARERFGDGAQDDGY